MSIYNLDVCIIILIASKLKYARTYLYIRLPIYYQYNVNVVRPIWYRCPTSFITLSEYYILHIV